MTYTTEDDVEQALIAKFQELEYTHIEPSIANPDGTRPERLSNGEVLLAERLESALNRLNPEIPADALESALKKLVSTETPNLVEENRRLHKYLIEGIDIQYRAEDGTLRGDKVKLLDFADLGNNDWLVLNQFTVIEQGNNRRPDVVVFVNGMPLGVIELKNPADKNATISAAYNQLQTYKDQIPSLFRSNAILVTSDGTNTRIGSLTADEERFMPWRTTDGQKVAAKGTLEQHILIEGVFEKSRFLSLIRHFTVFGEHGGHTIKIIAGYHQFHAVLRAVESTIRALPKPTPENVTLESQEDPATYDLPSASDHPKGDKRIGVIWHTQGSGKSLVMAFYAGQLVQRPEMKNPTLVIITDRRDLDDQLYGTFVMCKDLIRQNPIQAKTRENLQKLLDIQVGGVIFTTIQKFSPLKDKDTYPILTDRCNVVVIADEAHRSQYGFGAQVEQETGEITYGFAKYLRDALPNASFIGFTGTPIEKTDVNTPAVFGDYIDIYDISRAVEDNATVPIYYESRLARIELPDDEKPVIDAEIAEITEDESLNEQERLKRKWAAIEALVGAEKRLQMIAEDLVEHFENRINALEGKGMIVCMSRQICVALYDKIIACRPDWHSDDITTGTIKIVMSGSPSDLPGWQKHIGNKSHRDRLAKRIKDANDPLKLIIVCDMWLTGFDAPSLHTMYIDKPMKGHGLMQAIARVNRVFKDKPAGLVVDYIGLAQNLKNALGQYSTDDQKQTGIDESEAVRIMMERFDIVQSMFHGFDYRTALNGTSPERLTMLAEAIEWVLELQHSDSKKKSTKDEKKKAHRRYQDAVLALSKAFALAAASDEARLIRDDVGFFQTVRIALVKSSSSETSFGAGQNFAIQQIIDRSVVSTEIVDILSAVGLTTPDISILSEEFLEEIRQMPRKNLALQALKKLINDEIRSRSRSNVVQSRRFSEQLEHAITRYHTNALTTVEVIQELIHIAKQIRTEKEKEETEKLSKEEIAFYDALADNQSAVEKMGDEKLRVIAQELLNNIKANISIDWQRRKNARDKIKVLVKRALRKYGYPPDLQNEAVKTVLKQAEAIAEKLAT